VILVAPAEPRHIEQHPSLLDLLRRIHPPGAAARVGAIKNQAAHALGMARGVLDGGRPALAGAEEREPVEARGIDHALEVAYPRLE
jgi:hypothetical protein